MPSSHHKQRMIWPGRRLVVLAMVWLTIAWLGHLMGLATQLNAWKGVGAALLMIALVDAGRLLREQPAFSYQRRLPLRWPVHRSIDAESSLSHQLKRVLHVHLHEALPEDIESPALPLSFSLAPNQVARVHWPIMANRRGEQVLLAAEVAWSSAWGLWQRRETLPARSEVKVYPDFNLIIRYGRLAGDRRLNQIGIHSQQRRGSGTDFDQLRDYREGDSLRQIDWHATARFHRLIAKSYQEERSQRVVFLQDCSRRLRAMDGQQSHFDQSLNALLLLAHVALKQGDEIALETVGQDSDLPTRLGHGRGQSQFAHLLETVLRLYPANTTPDFAEAAGRLMSQHKRRSLIVVLTNLRDEDHQDLNPALRVLRQRHLVIVADLREVVEKSAAEAAGNAPFDQALLEAGERWYHQQRRTATRQLRQLGVIHLDVEPQDLPAALVSQYRQLKSSGSF